MERREGSNCPSCRKPISKDTLCRNLAIEQAIDELVSKGGLQQITRSVPLEWMKHSPREQRKSCLKMMISWNLLTMMLVILLATCFINKGHQHNTTLYTSHHFYSDCPGRDAQQDKYQENNNHQDTKDNTKIQSSGQKLDTKPQNMNIDDNHFPLSTLSKEMFYHSQKTTEIFVQLLCNFSAKTSQMLRSQLIRMGSQLFDFLTMMAKQSGMYVGLSLGFLVQFVFESIIELAKWLFVASLILFELGQNVAILIANTVVKMVTS